MTKGSDPFANMFHTIEVVSVRAFHYTTPYIRSLAREHKLVDGEFDTEGRIPYSCSGSPQAHRGVDMSGEQSDNLLVIRPVGMVEFCQGGRGRGRGNTPCKYENHVT